MRALRVLTFGLILAFGVLSVAHSQSAQVYTSQHTGAWGLMLGNCQLKVETFGSGVAFVPIGNSSTQFLGAIPDAANAGQPLELVQSAVRGENRIEEKLKIFFVVRDAQVQPDHYSFMRKYLLSGRNTGDYYTVTCGDLKPDSI